MSKGGRVRTVRTTTTQRHTTARMYVCRDCCDLMPCSKGDSCSCASMASNLPIALRTSSMRWTSCVQRTWITIMLTHGEVTFGKLARRGSAGSATACGEAANALPHLQDTLVALRHGLLPCGGINPLRLFLPFESPGRQHRQVAADGSLSDMQL